MPSIAGRHIVSVFDLTDDEIEGVFRLADRFLLALQQGPLSLVRAKPRARATKRAGADAIGRICANQILATVFHEPSTRTRLSFEAAMQRLGGRVISVADARTSSAAKGERLSDTIRVIAGYADAIVLRHPNEGSALLAAESLNRDCLAEIGRRVPVINGGDGAHEHPTQTLCDLYTIRRDHKKIAGLKVALYGDLLHARTAHSLAYGLARFGAEIKCISAPELRLPGYVKRRLELEFDSVPAEYDSFRQLVDPARQDVIYAAGKSKQRAARPLPLQNRGRDPIGRVLDAVYVTRLQKERFREPALAEAVRGSYMIDKGVLDRIGRRTTIMHPLPRVNEVDFAVDTDRRAAYFRQASYGIPVRMALLALLLGRKKLRKAADEPPRRRAIRSEVGEWVRGAQCANQTCVTNCEAGLEAHMEKTRDPNLLRCRYCDEELDLSEELG